MSGNRIVSEEIVRMVDTYVNDEIANAERWTNRELLDESGIYSLHRLACEVYALGFESGERVASERELGKHLRQRNAETVAAKSAVGIQQTTEGQR